MNECFRKRLLTITVPVNNFFYKAKENKSVKIKNCSDKFSTSSCNKYNKYVLTNILDNPPAETENKYPELGIGMLCVIIILSVSQDTRDTSNYGG